MSDQGRLVLTRKKGQQVVLFDESGREVCIEIVRTTGTYVRLCIEAPRQVRVVRGELEAKSA